MKTYAPSFINCSAVATPMPLLPPVMSASFPSSFFVCFSSSIDTGMRDRTLLRRPTQSTEPRSASDRDRIDQSEGNQTSALRQEHMGEVAGPAQRYEAAGSADRQAHKIARQRPRKPT